MGELLNKQKALHNKKKEWLQKREVLVDWQETLTNDYMDMQADEDFELDLDFPEVAQKYYALTESIAKAIKKGDSEV